MNLASWHTRIIFNKKLHDYSCAYWFWSIAQNRTTAHHKQADFSSTAAMKNLCFMGGWDQLNNQYQIKAKTAGRTWNLFLSCHRYCGIACLSEWNNNREASGQIVCFPSLGESAFFPSQHIRGGWSIVMQCQRPLGLKKCCMCGIGRAKKKHWPYQMWSF